MALAEEEITRNPLTGTVSLQVPEQPVPVLTVGQIRALFKACEGKDFASHRDMAMVRLCLDSGIRLAQLAGLAVEDVDLDSREALVLGKGRRTRVVVYGHKATLALNRCQRPPGARREGARCAAVRLRVAEGSRCGRPTVVSILDRSGWPASPGQPQPAPQGRSPRLGEEFQPVH